MAIGGIVKNGMEKEFCVSRYTEQKYYKMKQVRPIFIEEEDILAPSLKQAQKMRRIKSGRRKNMNKNIKVFYDRESDVLYISKEGREEKFVELFPGINVELNEKGEFIGIEILNASKMLRDVVEPLRERRTA